MSVICPIGLWISIGQLQVHLYDATAVVSQAVRMLAHRADQILQAPRGTMGPPRAKDNRVALAATIVAG